MNAAPTIARRPRGIWLESIVLASIAALAVAISAWIVAGAVGILSFSDSSDYLAFADFYRGQFYGETRPQDLAFYRATRFPPLFPFLLAALGGGTHALQYTQGIACGITLGMFMMLWAWIRRETGSALAAATLTLLVVLSPGLFLLTLNPVSEPLAMALTWLAFLLARDARSKSDRYLLVALIAGLSALARSINLALVLAIPIWMLLQRPRPERWLAATATAVAPVLAWMLYRRTLPHASSYADAFDPSFVVSELGGWPDLLWVHPWRLVTAFAKNFDTTPDPISIVLALILLSAATTGWWVRARQRRLDAVFLMLYVGTILVWPFPDEAIRFVTFVLPLVLFHCWVGMTWIIARTRLSPEAPRFASAATGALALLASAGTLAHFTHLATYTIDPRLRGEQRAQAYFHAPDRTTAVAAARGLATIRVAAREATRLVPPEECVYAALPHLLKQYAATAVKRYPARLSDAQPIEHQLSECGFLFVVGIPGSFDDHVPFYPLRLVEPKIHVVFAARVERGSAAAMLLKWNDDVDERRRALLQNEIPHE